MLNLLNEKFAILATTTAFLEILGSALYNSRFLSLSILTVIFLNVISSKKSPPLQIFFAEYLFYYLEIPL